MDARLDKLQRALRDAIAGISPEEMSRRVEGKWCVAEVLEHLYLTYTGTAKGFGRVREGGKSLATTATFAQKLRTLLVLDLGYFPEGRKSPAVAQPRGLPAEQVVAGIFSAIVQMDEAIAVCEKTFGVGKKVLDHPILGPLSCRQWKKFHLVHGLHHVKQIRRLRQASSS